jgi:hypothetical protein
MALIRGGAGQLHLRAVAAVNGDVVTDAPSPVTVTGQHAFAAACLSLVRFVDLATNFKRTSVVSGDQYPIW